MHYKNNLKELSRNTIIVADTSDISSMMEFNPKDATTNPTLLAQAVSQPEYEELLVKIIKEQETLAPSKELIQKVKLDFTNRVGYIIAKTITGRVSVEVDACLSYDIKGTISQAKGIIKLFEKNGIEKDIILVKIAATWEGITAASHLEKLGINCNLTLIFSLVQAAKCAELGVTLISPFVGRITDWFKIKKRVTKFLPEDDPGVNSVKNIYDYLKFYGYSTEIMGASFRNIEQIKALNGCDLLTIAPKLLAELQEDTKQMPPKLNPKQVINMKQKKLELDEKEFRWLLNQDAMATEKLAEGIRNFHEADSQLKNKILGLISSLPKQ